MELKPVKHAKEKRYPTATMYHSSKSALLVAALASLGYTAHADHPRIIQSVPVQDVEMVIEIDDDDDAEEPPPELTEEQKAEFEKTKKEVQAIKAKLGAEDYKTRREATKKLIEIGTTKRVIESKSETGKPRTTTPYRELVTTEMEALLKHDDPEVSERAKTIIKAITPKPRPQPVFRGGGAVAW